MFYVHIFSPTQLTVNCAPQTNTTTLTHIAQSVLAGCTESFPPNSGYDSLRFLLDTSRAGWPGYFPVAVVIVWQIKVHF